MAKKLDFDDFGDGVFLVNVLGIVYDPKEKLILVGKRENDPYVKSLTWSFPGGKARHDEALVDSLKKEIKEKTGLKVESLGAILTRKAPEKDQILLVYYLCEPVSGKAKAGGSFKELKWVKPEELQKYFKTSFHPDLKEYILNLK